MLVPQFVFMFSHLGANLRSTAVHGFYPWCPVELYSRVAHHVQWVHHHRFLEVISLFQPYHLELCIAQQVDSRNVNGQVVLFVGRQALVLQVFVEGIHIVGSHAEDVQCLNVAQTSWDRAWMITAVQLAATLQRILKAF